MTPEAKDVSSSIFATAALGLELGEFFCHYMYMYRHVDSRTNNIAKDVSWTKSFLIQLKMIMCKKQHKQLWKQAALDAAIQASKQCEDVFKGIKLALESRKRHTICFSILGKDLFAVSWNEPDTSLLVAELEHAKSTVYAMWRTVVVAETLHLYARAHLPETLRRKVINKTTTDKAQATAAALALLDTDSATLTDIDSYPASTEPESANIAKDSPSSPPDSLLNEKASSDPLIASTTPVFTLQDKAHLNASFDAAKRLASDLELARDIINAAGPSSSAAVVKSSARLEKQYNALPVPVSLSASLRENVKGLRDRKPPGHLMALGLKWRKRQRVRLLGAVGMADGKGMGGEGLLGGAGGKVAETRDLLRRWTRLPEAMIERVR